MKAIRDRLFEIVCAQTELDCEEQRSPLGYLRSGRPVWPITGAANDDDDDEDDSDDDDDDEDDDDDSGVGDKKKKKSKSADDDDDEDESPVSAEEFARLKRRMKRADQRASKAEADLAALTKKGTPENEQQVAALKEATEDRDHLREVNKALVLQNSFYLSNTYTWHDPELVMAQVLKDDDVEIDDEGHVSGMEAALKRIAQKKPFLIKAAAKKDDDDDEDDDDEDEDDDTSKRSSGAPQSRRRTKGGADRAKILQTYPALNRR